MYFWPPEVHLSAPTTHFSPTPVHPDCSQKMGRHMSAERGWMWPKGSSDKAGSSSYGEWGSGSSNWWPVTGVNKTQDSKGDAQIWKFLLPLREAWESRPWGHPPTISPPTLPLVTGLHHTGLLALPTSHHHRMALLLLPGKLFPQPFSATAPVPRAQVPAHLWSPQRGLP